MRVGPASPVGEGAAISRVTADVRPNAVDQARGRHGEIVPRKVMGTQLLTSPSANPRRQGSEFQSLRN